MLPALLRVCEGCEGSSGLVDYGGYALVWPLLVALWSHELAHIPYVRVTYPKGLPPRRFAQGNPVGVVTAGGVSLCACSVSYTFVEGNVKQIHGNP